MINVRAIEASEFDEAIDFIQSIFPDRSVEVSDDDVIIVAEFEDQYVGFAHIAETEDALVLQGLGVESSMRGQGIGTMIVEHVMELLKETYKPIFIKTKALNNVVRLYERYGFCLKRFGNSITLVKKPDN